MASSAPARSPDLLPHLAAGWSLHWLLAPRLPAGGMVELPPGGLQGSDPLSWWAAGSYAGPLRRRLLWLRRHPDGPLLMQLLPGLAEALRRDLGSQTAPPLLVPVPSWKRQANPLPLLLCQGLARQLGWPIAAVLRRSRPVLGQHHLGRELRWANQAGAFLSERPGPGRRGPRPTVLVVDDILTTGATVLAAASALQTAGWRLAGAACLARTPAAGP